MPVAGLRLLAHRCGQRRGVENTLSAFKRAREDGADAVECDVRLSCDGEPVVFHDDDLRRAAGRPQRVRALPWRELSRVSIFGGERIPHLRDLLDALADWPQGQLTLDLHEDRLDLAEAVADAVDRSGLGERCGLLAFYSDRRLLRRARELRSGTRLSVMPGAPWNIAPALELAPAELCLGWDKPLHRALYSAACRLYPAAARIAGARAAGVAVSGGIANTPADVGYFLAQGVEGIWTDDVPMAREALAASARPARPAEPS